MKFTLRLPDNEGAIIDAYCEATGRTKTDVLREFVRSLASRKQSVDGDWREHASTVLNSRQHRL